MPTPIPPSTPAVPVEPQRPAAPAAEPEPAGDGNEDPESELDTLEPAERERIARP